MKSKNIWTNYKIYAFLLGVVAGTLIYNLMGIDFSFSMYKKIEIINAKKSFIYFLSCNISYLIIIFIISFFEIKNKILPIIIFYQSFVLAGIITIIILSGNRLCLYTLPETIIKISAALFMFEDAKPIINRLISCIIIIIGTVLENFFIIYF